MNRHRRHVWALALLLVLGLAALPLAAVADDGPAPREKKAEGEKADAPKPDAKKAKPAASKRRPLLWMVESNPRVFLYGTIHVADPRVTKHLPVVQAALDQSTALYTELQLDAAGQMQMQQVVMSMGMMTDGTTLEEALGTPLHQRVGKALPPQMPIQMLGAFKPWLIQFLLMQTMMSEHQKAEARKKAKAASSSADVKSGPSSSSGGGAAGGVAGVALDPMLYAEAQKAGKQVGGLETIKAQVDVFDSLSVEAQVKMVEGVVEEIEKIREQAKKDEANSKDDAKKDEAEKDEKDEKDDVAKKDDEGHVNALSKMIDMWLAGDDQGFMDIFEKDLRKQGGEESQKFVEGLLDNRNVGMAAKVQELMKAHPDKTFFIAVGAAHMPGAKGVVKLLTDAGFKVRRMELGDKVPALPKKAEPKKEPAGSGG